MLKIRHYNILLCLLLPLIIMSCPSPETEADNPEAPANAKLSALIISEGTLEPDFDADEDTYYLEFGAFVDSITITATAADPAYEKMLLRLNESEPWKEIDSGVSETIDLEMNNNKVEIAVTAKDKKTVKTYTININNTGNPAADLSLLSISTGTLSFKSNTKDYNVFYSSFVSSITITATPTDTHEKVKLELNLNNSSWEEIPKGEPTRALGLKVPFNTIIIKVTARDEITSKEYTISIFNTGSNNANLSALSISTGSLNFNQDTPSYNLTYENFVSSVTVTATAADLYYNRLELKLNSGAWSDITSGVASQALPLDVGFNTIQIRVTAQDTTTTNNYFVNINNIGSSNAKLSSLAISTGTLTPDFNSDMHDYSVFYSVLIDSITITATTAHPLYYKLQLKMNEGLWTDLISGTPSNSLTLWSGPNTAEVRVIAQDKTTIETYNIAIRNLGDSNANLASLKVSAGTVSPQFNSLIDSYTVNLPEEVAAISIKPVTSFARCYKVEIASNGGEWIQVYAGSFSEAIALPGNSTVIAIKVTAEDTVTEKTYTLNVKKIDFENWQSREVPGQASPQAWNAVTMASSNNNNLAAVVKYGNIYTSVDGGVSWTGHNIAGTNNNWTAITSSTDGSILAAVANNDYIYTSLDGGESWQQYTGQGKRNWYSIVSSSDGRKLAAIAASSYIFISSNGGTTWEPRLNDVGRSWRAITSSTDGENLAAVGSGLKVWTSDDGGNQWHEQVASDAYNWRAITSSADGSFLAAVVDGGCIYTSVNYGANWSVRKNDTPRAWRSIASSSTGQYLAAVVNNGYVYTSSNYGVAWDERRPVDNNTRSWSSITSSPDGRRLVAVVNGGLVYTSSDYGVSWTEQQQSSTRKWCSMAASYNGDYLAAAVNNGYIYTSKDKGVTWQERLGADKRAWSAIASSANGLVLTAVVNDGYIFQCANAVNSDSWGELRPVSTPSLWRGLTTSADGSRLAAVTDNGYIYTKDGAANWIARKNDIPRSWRAIASSDDGNRLAAVISGSRVIYASSDFGSNWPYESYVSDKALSWNSISSSADGTILAATAEEPPLKGYIYISTDSGSTWLDRTPAGSRVWRSISMSADGGLMAAVAHNDYIYTSLDQGVTWVARTRLGLRAWRAIIVSADGAFMGAAAENEMNVFTCY